MEDMDFLLLIRFVSTVAEFLVAELSPKAATAQAL
jgi:hypothetical protein